MDRKPLAESAVVRAAIYARVSSELQAQRGTIGSQVEALRQRVREDALTLDEELCFIDDGYTGSTLIRPALDRLRDVAWAGGFQRLYVHSPDRLARKYAWQVLLVEELRRCGVDLVFLNRTIGVSPEEDLLLQMQGVIAEYERTKFMERSRRGKRHAARQGAVAILVAAPYGYRYIRKHDGGGQAAYQVQLEEAKVVRQIFEWFGHDRVSTREIVRRLARDGIASAKGKGWHAETVRKLLQNPAYKGQALFGKSRVGERRPRLRPGRGRPEQPRQATSRYPGKPQDQVTIPVPALVSAELFDAVAGQLADNRKHCRQQQGGPSYLLQGLLECGCCGYAFYGHGNSRFARLNNNHVYPYYRCLGRDGQRFGGKPICSNKPLRLDRLEAAVWADVREVLQNPEELQREFERRLSGESQSDVNLDQVNKQIAASQRGISRLIDAYEGGLIEKDEFEPRLRQARERLARLQEEAAKVANDAARQAELRLILSHLDQFADQVRQGLDQADWNTRREIIRSLVKVVKIDPEHVRITYRISPRPFVDGRSGGQLLQHCHYRVQRHPPRDQHPRRQDPLP
jgi:site-specific DNA recombinase